MSKQNIILQPLGLAMVLTVGCAFVIALLVALIVLAPIEAGNEIKVKQISEDIVILRDGTPIIRRFEKYKYAEDRTLDGKQIDVSYKELTNKLEPAWLPGPFNLKKVWLPLESTERIVPVVSRSPKEAYWYFVHDGNLEGKGYFIGYDSKSWYCIGYYGRLGPSQNIPPEEEWFAMDVRKLIWTVLTWNSYRYSGREESFLGRIMISGNQLLFFVLPRGSVTTLMESNDMICVNLLELQKPDQDYEFNPNLWVLRTSDRIILFDMSGKQLSSYVIPKDLRNPEFGFYELGDEKALIYRGRKYTVDKGQEQLTWIDTSGKILRREEVVLAGSESYYLFPENTRNWISALLVPEPIFMIFDVLVMGPERFLESEINEEMNYTSALARTLPNVWAPLLAVCILSAVLAWLNAYRQQRR